MKKVMAGLGLVIGVLLGTALLMLNPVTLMQPRPVGLAGAVQALGWQDAGGSTGFAMTPAGVLGVAGDREKGAGLALPGIRYARAEVVALAGDSGMPEALGVRLSAIADENSLMKARLGIVTSWNLVWPQRGSVLLAGSENLWTPLRDGLWSAVRGRGWNPGRERYLLAPLPEAGTGLVVKRTGEFSGSGGAFREQFTPLASRPGDLTGQRELQLVLE